jgi:hypothetical protein
MKAMVKSFLVAVAVSNVFIACGSQQKEDASSSEGLILNSGLISATLALQKRNETSTKLPVYCWMISPGGAPSPLTLPAITMAEAEAEMKKISARNPGLKGFVDRFFQAGWQTRVLDSQLQTVKVSVNEQVALVSELGKTFQDSKANRSKYAAKTAVCK